MQRFKTARFLAILLIVAVGLAVGAYFWVVNPQALQTWVLQQVDRSFGTKIRIGHLQVSLFPDPQVDLFDVSLGAEEGDPYFRASHVTIEMLILPLLSGQIMPKNLMIDRPELTIRRGADGLWGIPFQNGNSMQTESLNELWLISAFSMANGRIQLRDESRVPVTRELVLENVHVELERPARLAMAEFTASASVRQKEAEAVLSLSGTMEALRSAVGSRLAARSDAVPPVTITGRAHMEKTDLEQIAAFFNFSALPLSAYGLTSTQTAFRITPGVQGYDLVLSEFELQTQVVQLHGSANVSGILSDETPALFLTVSSNPLSIHTLLDLFPQNSLPDALHEAMQADKFGGKVEVISASIAGSQRADVGFSLVGEFAIADGYLDFGEVWGRAEQIDGRIVLRPEEARFFDAHGIYESIAVSAGRGTLNLHDPDWGFSTELHGYVPTDKFVPILHKVFDKNDTLGPLRSLKGTKGGGQLTIRFAGPLARFEEIGFQDAVYVVEGGGLDIPELDKSLSNISGNVTFTRQEMGFERVTLTMGRSGFAINGGIRFGGNPTFEDLRVQGVVETQEWWGADRSRGRAKGAVHGTATVDATIRGPVRVPSFAGHVNFDRVAMTFPGFFSKARGIPGSLDLEGRFRTSGEVALSKIDVSLLPLRVTGRGSVQTGRFGGVNLAVAAEPVDISLLPEGMLLGDGALKSGHVEISLQLMGSGSDWRNWKKDGWLALTDGVYEKPGLDEKVTDIFLRLKLTGHLAEVKRLEFHILTSQADAKGTIRNWETQPVVALELNSSAFDLDLLIPKGARSPMRDFLEAVADSSTVEGIVHIAKGWYKGLTFSPLRAQIQIQKNFVSVNRIQGQLDPGSVNGRLLVYLPPRKPAAVKTWVDIRDVPMGSIFETFVENPQEHACFITGQLTVSGAVQGHGRGDRGVMPTLKGEVEAAITNGRIERGTVIPKIMALLNLPMVLQGKVDLQEKGYAFDKMSATLSLEKGIVTSNNIVVDSPLFKMTGAGTYDLVQDQVEGVAAVSPFGSYSDLLKKIPLFGILLEGEREAIDTALFEVKGPFNDPAVTYQPLKSFQAGITGFAKLAINVLRNTVSLPQRLLSPKEDGAPPPSTPSPPRSGNPDGEPAL